MVILVERDYNRMKRTYMKHKYHDMRIYGHDIGELIEMARYHYAEWDGPKMRLRFEDLTEAVSTFDLERARK